MAVSTAQEEYLKRIREGMQREAARGVAKTERGFAARGIGRHIGAQAATGRLAAQYAQKIGETVGGIRAGAEEKTAGRAFESGEAAKQRRFAAEQALLERRAQMKLLKEQKKKTPLEQIGQAVDIFF